MPTDDLSEMMRAASRGDDAAYRRALELISRWLRPVVLRGLARAGRGREDAEDIVQETLLAVHLKRDTWDQSRPVEPWLRAIAHYKLVDAMRRRGFEVHVAIDDGDGRAIAASEDFDASTSACDDILALLPQSQRQIVEAITISGHSASEVGAMLGMTEGAVRVALHRALKSLAAGLKREPR